jgi:hypothetical protein
LALAPLDPAAMLTGAATSAVAEPFSIARLFI